VRNWKVNFYVMSLCVVWGPLAQDLNKKELPTHRILKKFLKNLFQLRVSRNSTDINTPSDSGSSKDKTGE